MASVVLADVCKSYQNGFQAVKNFNLEIQDGEFIIFVGPSGCGKSTTLRMIAGLDDISSGELWIDGNLSNFVEPGNRGLSMVFQNYALYPYMTVYENMAFSLRCARLNKREIDSRVRQTAELLQIGHLLNRRPGALSGGQKQRVAIGSVLVRQTKLLLMDEPLSNLDAKLRAQMRVELARIHRKLGSTIIYVTHDQVEAMTLGTRIVVLKDGVIQQVAAPDELYRNPVNRFVAGFIGSPSMNFIPVEIAVREGHLVLMFGENRIWATPGLERKLFESGYAGKTMIMGIRPEDLMAEETADSRSYMEMETAVQENLGAEILAHGEICGEPVCVRLPQGSRAVRGEKIRLYPDMDKMILFDKETERNVLL